LLYVRQNGSQEALAFTNVVIASDKNDALNQAEAAISEGEFISDTRGFVVENSSVDEVDRELIEQAATDILGWSPPAA
jgi:hypothetical protein